MSKIIKFFTVASFIFGIICFVMNLYLQISLLLTLTITFATITYHFGMRLIVGFVVNKVMNNKADYNKKWYQIHRTEKKLYEIIKVKRWKNKMPSYEPKSFSPEKHTWDEIAQAMCQAEIVHEIIIIFSFLPIIASIFYGAFYVFLITSVCAAFFDLIFVVMQRYNRPRVIKLAISAVEKRR